jgi:GAF domain
MAVKLKDVLAQMQAIVAAEGGDPNARAAKILELAADFLAVALAGAERNGQTAILMVDADLEQLTFAYPEHLARGNTLPIDRNSFAGQVVLQKSILLQNNVPAEPHKDFFERIPNPEGEVRAIQKMIASPLLDRDGQVIGVVEVSRTGRESSGRDADFTRRDLENLEKCCRVFAPFIAQTWARRTRTR